MVSDLRAGRLVESSLAFHWLALSPNPEPTGEGSTPGCRSAGPQESPSKRRVGNLLGREGMLRRISTWALPAFGSVSSNIIGCGISWERGMGSIVAHGDEARRSIPPKKVLRLVRSGEWVPLVR